MRNLTLPLFLALLSGGLWLKAGTNLATTFPFIWVLHLGVFAVFIPFVFFSRKDLPGRRALLTLAEGVPRWVAVLGGVLLPYVLMNFLFVLHIGGGNPVEQEGKFLLMSHGKLVRELTASEYIILQTNQLRGFSGHWLVFYFAPAAYFLFWRRPDSTC